MLKLMLSLSLITTAKKNVGILEGGLFWCVMCTLVDPTYEYITFTCATFFRCLQIKEGKRDGKKSTVFSMMKNANE